MSHDAGAHAPIFILLSIAVAVLGSWAALEMFRQVRGNAGPPAMRWLGATGVAFGLSIWSMHFVAMLGWDPGVPIRYELGLTALSLVLPILASGLGFYIATTLKLRALGVALTSLVVGAAITAMHYVGMAAVRGPLLLHFDPVLVAASYGVASGAAAGGLWAAGREVGLRWRVASAVVLGLAIVGMHYTGMAALRVTLDPTAAAVPTGLNNLVLAAWVSTSTALLLAMAVITAGFDRRRIDLAEREASALTRSQRRQRLILEQMPVGALIAEAPSGAILFGNAAAERILGHPIIHARGPEEYRQYGSLLPSGAEQPPEHFALSRALRGQRTEAERQLYRRPDGEVITLEVSAAPIRNEAGEVELGIVAFQDVTAAMKAEEGLRRSQQLEAIGQLTGGVAHDFNNLLTAVIGSIHMAMKRVEDPRARDLLQNALHGAERGAKLTGQLLAFSRRQRLETRPVDVNAMVSGMEGLLTSTLGPSVRVRFDLAGGLPAATADPTQLELAVLNLAINARDAMTGGGDLTISTSHVELGPSDVPPGDGPEPEPGRYVVIGVADTGAGMKPDVLARAFEPFFTTKPVGKGSGLGLSQVLGLAKQMGGGVRVETVEGEGSTVRVYLPRAAAKPKAGAPAAAEPAPARTAPTSVLVVDDDPDVRRYVTALLEDAGYAVIAAASGVEALELVEGGAAPDIVLMDFAMPGLNGLETAERIRRIRPKTPVLVMTGYADLDALPAELDRARLMQKPFESDALLRRLDAMLAAA